MVIQQNGNVGIGTSSPNYKLAVNGSLSFAAGMEGAGHIQSPTTVKFAN